MALKKWPVLVGILFAWPAIVGAQEPAESTATPESAETAPDSAMFQIRDPDGTIIGEQIETHETGALGITAQRAHRIAFTIDGHEPVEAFSRVKVTRGGTGAAQGFEAEYGNRQRSVTYRAEIAGTSATITRNASDDPQSYTQQIPPGLAIADPEALTAELSGPFLAFDPSLGRFYQAEAKTFTQGDDARFPGELRVIYRDGFPVDIRILMRNAAGATIGAVQPQPGAPLHFARVDPADGPISIDRGGRIDHPMVASPHTISDAAKNSHLRFRITLPRELSEALPQTAQQAVKLTEDGPQIDICADCGPGLPTDPDSLMRWTRPTAWLQSDFEPIARRGAAMARRRASDRRKLELLSRLVRGRLSGFDFNGHYSARASWERRAGDCTEDAVLLAAYARAAGIPTLVASGLAYSRDRYHGTANAFMPHAWIVAYADGEWISFDMTLEEGFGASHIALSLSEGEAGQMVAANMLAGLLEWRSLSEVRPTPAP